MSTLPGVVGDFGTAYRLVAQSLKGLTFAAGGTSWMLGYTFFNEQPELRNETQPRIPGLVLTTRTPYPSEDWVVNEEATLDEDLTAASAYLEATIPTGGLAIVNNSTVDFLRGYEDHAEDWPASYKETLISIKLLRASFADPDHATVGELVAALSATGLVVSATGRVIRVRHTLTGGFASLQVSSGSTAALALLFPQVKVFGRSEGTYRRTLQPLTYYELPFRVTVLTARADHHWAAGALLERLWRVTTSPTERALSIGGVLYQVDKGRAQDDPVPGEGVFSVTLPFVIRRVPLSWDLATQGVDVYNGGLYDGSGLANTAPKGTTFYLSIDPTSEDLS